MEEITNKISTNKQNLLLKIIAYLKGKQLISTQKELADIIGHNDKNLSSATKGNERYLTDGLFNKIYKKFPQTRAITFEESKIIGDEITIENLSIEEKLNNIFITINNNNAAYLTFQKIQDRNIEILNDKINHQKEIIKQQSEELKQIKMLLKEMNKVK